MRPSLDSFAAEGLRQVTQPLHRRTHVDPPHGLAVLLVLQVREQQNLKTASLYKCLKHDNVWKQGNLWLYILTLFTGRHTALVLKAPDMLIDRLKFPQGTSEPESNAANRYTGRLTCSCGSIWPSWFCLECFLMVLHYLICLLFKMLLFTKMSLAQTR